MGKSYKLDLAQTQKITGINKQRCPLYSSAIRAG